MAEPQLFTSIPEVLASIQSSFDPSKAAGERATIQFDLSGEGGGRYWVSIMDGSCSHGLGDAAPPVSVTIACSTDDWLAILNHTKKPMAMFALGRLKVSGDHAVALKLQRWFPERR